MRWTRCGAVKRAARGRRPALPPTLPGPKVPSTARASAIKHMPMHVQGRVEWMTRLEAHGARAGRVGGRGPSLGEEKRKEDAARGMQLYLEVTVGRSTRPPRTRGGSKASDGDDKFEKTRESRVHRESRNGCSPKVTRCKGTSFRRCRRRKRRSKSLTRLPPPSPLPPQPPPTVAAAYRTMRVPAAPPGRPRRRPQG